MKRKLYPAVYILTLAISITSCNKRNDYSNNIDVIREWNFNLSSSNEVFVRNGSEVEASFHMVLIGDSSLRYDINIDSTSDRISTVNIHLGDPVSEGPVLVSLPVRIYRYYGSGSATGLRAGLMDTLLNNTIEKYINVTTDKDARGLVRGQLNSDLVFSKNVALTGTALVPPQASTTTSGTALLRVTSNNILYSKVIVANDDPADPVTTASVNQGTSTANGTAIFNLVSSPQEFGLGKKSTLSASTYSGLINNNSYVIVNSTLSPNGKIRGHVR